jgi:hypothetical protein
MGYDISNFINFDEGGKAWVGFTSGTGIASEEHFIDSWKFCPFEYYGIPLKSEENVIAKNEWIIYPNPADDYIMINNYALKNELLNIDIFDIFGNTVYSQPKIFTDGIFRIETSNLPTGKYFVRIIQGEQVSTSVFTIIR